MAAIEQDLTPPQAYAQYFVPAIFQPLSALLVEQAAPRPGERVLDLACGTGVVARRVAPLVSETGAVVGVDISPGMLDVARGQPPPSGAVVQWLTGDAGALDLPAAAFDLVLCQQGLQFFPDRLQALREVRRVLVDAGRLVLAVWHSLDEHPLFAALADAELPYLHELGASPDDVGVPFSLGDRAELRALLDAAGFGDATVTARSIQARFAAPERFVERMELAYAAVVPRLAEDQDAFARFVDTIIRATRPVVERYRQGDALVVPMHTNVVVARPSAAAARR